MGERLGIPKRDDESEVDGCDVEVAADAITLDEELPPSEGGVAENGILTNMAR
jgi:hypothetical protein